MPDVALIRQKYEALTSALNERARRLWAASARAASIPGRPVTSARLAYVM